MFLKLLTESYDVLEEALIANDLHEDSIFEWVATSYEGRYEDLIEEAQLTSEEYAGVIAEIAIINESILDPLGIKRRRRKRLYSATKKLGKAQKRVRRSDKRLDKARSKPNSNPKKVAKAEKRQAGANKNLVKRQGKMDKINKKMGLAV